MPQKPLENPASRLNLAAGAGKPSPQQVTVPAVSSAHAPPVTSARSTKLPLAAGKSERPQNTAAAIGQKPALKRLVSGDEAILPHRDIVAERIAPPKRTAPCVVSPQVRKLPPTRMFVGFLMGGWKSWTALVDVPATYASNQ
jgi:hypothetical protein